MKNKIQYVIILLILLVAITLVVFGVKRFIQPENENRLSNITVTPIEQLEEGFDVFMMEQNDIKSAEYRFDGGTYSFYRDGDSWTCSNELISKEDSNQVMDLLSKISAVNVIENPELKDYGLDGWNALVTIIGQDGQVQEIYVGKTNDINNHTYFMFPEDDSVIYESDDSFTSIKAFFK